MKYACPGLPVVLVGLCLWGTGLAAQQPMPPMMPPPPAMPGMAVPETPQGQTAADQVAPVQGDEAGGAPVSGLRDPFWPVGYAPKAIKKVPTVNKAGDPVPVSEQPEVAPEPVHVPQWDEARRKIDIRGISLIGRDKDTGKPKYLAMVAGKLVEEGAVVTLAYNEHVYRWKVVGISANGVSFQKLDVRKE